MCAVAAQSVRQLQQHRSPCRDIRYNLFPGPDCETWRMIYAHLAVSARAQVVRRVVSARELLYVSKEKFHK